MYDDKPIFNRAEEANRFYGAGRCIGYIAGLNSMQMIMVAWKLPGLAVSDDYKKDFLYCLPDNIEYTRQLTRVVVVYGKDHPENLHLEAGVFALMAFRHFYPCTEKRFTTARCFA